MNAQEGFLGGVIVFHLLRAHKKGGLVMKCPECNGETGVKDSRPGPENSIRRRRKCFECEHRFTSFELSKEQIQMIRAPLKMHVGELRRILDQANALNFSIKKNWEFYT